MATRSYPTGCPVELTPFHLSIPMAAIDLPELDSLQAEQWDRQEPPVAAQAGNDSCRSLRVNPQSYCQTNLGQGPCGGG